MAASNACQMSASLAVVQSAGASALELPMPMELDGAGFAQTSPMSMMSPWACSEACSSPWSPVTPAVTTSFTIKAAQVRSPGPVASPFFPGPSVPEAHAQTFPVKPFSVGGPAPASPAVCAPVAMSPTTQIRHNAASFGIPLNASYGEIGAPLPIRSQGGVLLAPSPTTRSSCVPPPAVPQAPAAFAVGAPGPLPFIRSIATPLTASHPRRAAGGA
mmetsp:Transcript_1755/g.5553  ORF Transcript_1755/g.5553 Transcript_1755/m.5553 type:complete len:216 (-) Transcript_1755:63-710(-)